MTTIIEAKKVSKSYGQGQSWVQVLKDIDLKVDSGDFTAIMGPSSSGKSTLLFAISGMDKIDSGQVLFNQQNLAELSNNQLADIRRQQMGFVFQNASMLPYLDILDNIILPAYQDYEGPTEQLTERAQSIMEQVGIADLANRKITEVSGGQLQRASICRALVHQPLILFGDEPTGALNSKSSEKIMDLFSDLNRDGMTILLVTHDAKVAAKTNQVLFMKDGQIESQLDLKEMAAPQKLQAVTNKMLALGI